MRRKEKGALQRMLLHHMVQQPQSSALLRCPLVLVLVLEPAGLSPARAPPRAHGIAPLRELCCTLMTGTDFAQGWSGAEWFDVVTRSAVRPDLPPQVLLHAGPPFRDGPPAPVVNAAVQSLVFEGLAADETEACGLLARGEAILRPAQDYGIVTPLAQVVSASMALGAVRHHAQVAYGALLEGTATALRFGSRQAGCRKRLEVFHTQMCRTVAPCLRRRPVGLTEVIRRAVAMGDDCHSRTAVANDLLVSSVAGLEPGIVAELRAVPAFVLPLLMAGAAAAIGHHGNPMAALGANGVDFGVRRRGESTWRQMAATAPLENPGLGPRPPHVNAAAQPGRPPRVPLPAIGDSVLIDYCGLGGQVDETALRRRLIDPLCGIIDPARIGIGRTPAFNLAILDSAGESGLIGRGVYHPPAELFAGDAPRSRTARN